MSALRSAGRLRPVARPQLRDVPVYEPGRAAPPGAIKLASNENSYGPSPAVLRAIRSFRGIERYPDGGASILREALARALRISADWILMGAGSDEIGDFLARAYLRPGDSVVYPKYTFVRYGMCAQVSGARRIATKVRPDLSPDLPALLRAIRRHRTRMVCLANPNNPTGAYLSRSAIREIFRCARPETLVVLDEAYFEYAQGEPGYPDGLEFVKSRPNAVVLRTFSKIHGLAALRVGFAVARPAVIAELHKVRPPFNVSAIGQAAALAALSHPSRVRCCAQLNARERARLSVELAELGFRVYPSAANFLLIGLPTGDGRVWFDQLSKAGVIVRSLGPYGLDRHLRITVGTRRENHRLIRAVRRVLRSLA